MPGSVVQREIRLERPMGRFVVVAESHRVGLDLEP